MSGPSKAAFGIGGVTVGRNIIVSTGTDTASHFHLLVAIHRFSFSGRCPKLTCVIRHSI